MPRASHPPPPPPPPRIGAEGDCEVADAVGGGGIVGGVEASLLSLHQLLACRYAAKPLRGRGRLERKGAKKRSRALVLRVG